MHTVLMIRMKRRIPRFRGGQSAARNHGTGQPQVFRNEDQASGKSLRPCFTWWMSATLQHAWLEKSPDTSDLTGELVRNTHRIGSGERVGHLWDDVAKPLEIVHFAESKAFAPSASPAPDSGYARPLGGPRFPPYLAVCPPAITGSEPRAGWPRAVAHPRLPQIRACPTQAPGSSGNGLAARRYTLFTTRAGGRG